MAILVENFLKERKYPFIFTLLILLICVTLVFFTNSAATSSFNRVVFYPDVKGQQPSATTPSKDEQGLPRKVTPIISPQDQGFPQNKNPITSSKEETPITVPKDEGLPEKEIPITEPKDEGLQRTEEASEIDTADVDIKWRLCKGPSVVDNIPCLDNWKVIKALKSRRHMEHRERHCPDITPGCLLPLPDGYKVPVPWPKSRDMVRLILR